MFVVVGLLRRRPDLDPAAFRRYYETHHRRLGEKYLAGYAVRYLRRYLTPFPDPITGRPTEPDCDVILEIWYPDRAAFERANRRLSEPAVAAEIAADEERLFDRPANRFYFVDEVESTLPDPPSHAQGGEL